MSYANRPRRARDGDVGFPALRSFNCQVVAIQKVEQGKQTLATARPHIENTSRSGHVAETVSLEIPPRIIGRHAPIKYRKVPAHHRGAIIGLPQILQDVSIHMS